MKNPSSPQSNNSQPETEEEQLPRLWKEFCATYASRADYYELLIGLTEEASKQCKKCGSYDLERATGSRDGKCKSCGKAKRFTAGTFFHGVKAVRAWAFAFWLYGKGVCFNGTQLSRLTGIAISSAWTIVAKIAMVLQSYMDAESTAVDLYSACFSEIFSKRSLKTPADEHPSAEQYEFEKREQSAEEGFEKREQSADSAPAGAANNVGKIELSGTAKLVFDCMSANPIHFNDLSKKTNLPTGELSSILIRLELAQLIENKPGDRYVLATSAPFATQSTGQSSGQSTGQSSGHAGGYTGSSTDFDMPEIVCDFIEFIKHGSGGISRKYLQLFLARYWFYTDRGRWSGDSLLKACRKHQAIKEWEIRAFVSPLFVKLMPG